MDLRTALSALKPQIVVVESPLHEDDTVTEAVKKVLLKHPDGLTIDQIVMEMINDRYDYKVVSDCLSIRVTEGLISRQMVTGSIMQFRYRWVAGQQKGFINNNDEDNKMATMKEEIVESWKSSVGAKRFDLNSFEEHVISNFGHEIRLKKGNAKSVARDIITAHIRRGGIRSTGKGDKMKYYFDIPKPKAVPAAPTEPVPMEPVAPVATAPEYTNEQLEAALVYPRIGLRAKLWLIAMKEKEILRSDLIAASVALGNPTYNSRKAITNAVAVGYLSLTPDEKDSQCDIFTPKEIPSSVADFFKSCGEKSSSITDTFAEATHAVEVKELSTDSSADPLPSGTIINPFAEAGNRVVVKAGKGWDDLSVSVVEDHGTRAKALQTEEVGNSQMAVALIDALAAADNIAEGLAAEEALNKALGNDGSAKEVVEVPAANVVTATVTYRGESITFSGAPADVAATVKILLS